MKENSGNVCNECEQNLKQGKQKLHAQERNKVVRISPQSKVKITSLTKEELSFRIKGLEILARMERFKMKPKVVRLNFLKYQKKCQNNIKVLSQIDFKNNHVLSRARILLLLCHRCITFFSNRRVQSRKNILMQQLKTNKKKILKIY